MSGYFGTWKANIVKRSFFTFENPMETDEKCSDVAQIGTQGPEVIIRTIY